MVCKLWCNITRYLAPQGCISVKGIINMKKVYSEHSHKGWFAILFLLFFAPFGIYLTFKHKHFKNKTRYIVSAVALGWFSLIVISAQPTEEQIEAREAAEEEKEREKAAEEQKKKEDE